MKQTNSNITSLFETDQRIWIHQLTLGSRFDSWCTCTQTSQNGFGKSLKWSQVHGYSYHHDKGRRCTHHRQFHSDHLQSTNFTVEILVFRRGQKYREELAKRAVISSVVNRMTELAKLSAATYQHTDHMRKRWID